MYYRSNISALFLLFILCSCSDIEELDRSEYISFVEKPENGLSVSKSFGDLEMVSTFCPLDYVIAKEFKINEISKKVYQKKSEDLRGSMYFKIRFQSKSKKDVSMHNLSNEQEVKERLEYMSYALDQNLFIVRNNRLDTIPVSLFHFERTYSIVPYLDVIFCFKEDAEAAKFDSYTTLLFRDDLFGHGNLTFEYKNSDILKAPKLKLF